ncbi:MAG: 16S rRNA (cytosine(967)-C(5))-methyltransferase RsmB [Ignavibacteriales bacterium CG_4_9_14_3_um_filter_34_10]|nr:MAG: 16S rRNA (cytosine(967)-C(5))-methyltransferase RsmB [Ignavibacteriales bacterium CG_4_9_14_3_um_filter_34_10]
MNESISQESTDFYEGVRGLAVKILNRIDRTDAYLDKILEMELKGSELKSIDKALLFEIVHGVIRFLSKIDWILNGFYKGQYSKCIPNIKNTLRVALYQILYLDKIPDYAAVNEAVEFIKKIQGQKPADLTNAVLRNIIKNKESLRFPNPQEDLVNYLSVFYSHPVWLVKKWVNIYGREFTEALMTANNDKPRLSLRVNNLKTNEAELCSLLDQVELKYSKSNFVEGLIKLNNLVNIADWEYFAKGYFAIQDESTLLSCILLDVKPEHRVLDMCAAPGGKTSILADMMNNEGQIVALDKYESRIKILEKNLQRLGVQNVKLVEADATEFEENDFDRILIDAPCSGLGTLTKKPDIKWKRDNLDIRKLNKTQYELISHAAKLVKVGGVIVYSTCTIEAEENFGIVKKFLFENPNFSLINSKDFVKSDLVDVNGCVQTFPHIHQMDGAFAAGLIRKF